MMRTPTQEDVVYVEKKLKVRYRLFHEGIESQRLGPSLMYGYNTDNTYAGEYKNNDLVDGDYKFGFIFIWDNTNLHKGDVYSYRSRLIGNYIGDDYDQLYGDAAWIHTTNIVDFEIFGKIATEILDIKSTCSVYFKGKVNAITSQGECHVELKK